MRRRQKKKFPASLAAILFAVGAIGAVVSPTEQPSPTPTPIVKQVQTMNAQSTPSPSPTPTITATPIPTVVPTPTPVPVFTFVYNKNTKKFHYEWCGSIEDMKPKNRGTFTGTSEEMQRKGYKPCQRCDPY